MTRQEQARKLCEMIHGPITDTPKAYQHESPYMEQLYPVKKMKTKVRQFTGSQDRVALRIECFINENQNKPGFNIVNQSMCAAPEGVTVMITYTIME